jgi:spore germination cell wall hydrolase CwlJ-like protein
MKLGWLLWLASFFPADVHDHTCLAATVYLEARDQTTLGQLAVAEVALRRRESGRWGSTLCEVLGKRKQFALGMTSPNFVVGNARAWLRAWKVSGDTISMWRLPPASRQFVVPGADHFVALQRAQPVWAQGQPVATIGDHTFYRVGL